RAAQAAPENLDYRLKLGAALVRARQYAAAVEPLSFALARAPERRDGHADLGSALFAMGRYAEATREFEWLAAHEQNAAVYYFLGASLDHLRRCRDALAAYEKFLSLADPKTQKTEVDDVSFRIPSLKRQIERGECDTAPRADEKRPVSGSGQAAKGRK